MLEYYFVMNDSNHSRDVKIIHNTTEFNQDIKLVIGCVDAILSFVAFLAHIIGLVSIYSCKNRTKRQNAILSALSIVELWTIIFHLAVYWDERNNKILYLRKVILMYEMLFIMYILTGDRLISFIRPYRHSYQVTPQKIRSAVYGTCVLSIFFGVLENHTKPDNTASSSRNPARYVLMTLGTLYGVLTIVTYSFAKRKINHSRTLSNSTPGNHVMQRKETIVPGLIILSFLLFICVPHLMFFYGNPNVIEQKILELVMMFGLLADPIIYVFVVPHYRNAIRSCFTGNQGHRGRVIPVWTIQARKNNLSGTIQTTLV